MTQLEIIPKPKVSRDSIYLHLSHRGDQQLLQSFLRENYHVVAGNGEWKDAHFDLLILDIPQLVMYRENIERLKKSHFPEILPLITLVDRKYQKLTKEISELPDDLLQLPVSPEIFISRVKAMLRIRGLSKAVESKNRSLQKKNEQMEKMLEQKQTLLQEIHHRVKNNLAVISGLIEIQSMGFANKETVEVLDKTRLRITSIAKVHELLYQQDDLNEIDFKQYVKNLSELVSSIHFDANSHINIDLFIDDIRVSIDQAVPLGLLLNELMSNSVEHGYSPQETPEILLKISSDGNNMIVDYRDCGSGLEEGIDLKNSGNFGMLIVRTLLRQLQAKWDYQSGKGKGVRFTFTFPKKQYGGPSKLI